MQPLEQQRAASQIPPVPAVDARLVKDGADPVGGTPRPFAQFVQRELDQRRAVVRESGARAE